MTFRIAANTALVEDQIYVAISHGLLGAHLGVAYQDEFDNSKLLHLAFHRNLCLEPYPKPDWLVSRVPIPEELASQIIAILNAAAMQYGNNHSPDGFEYGINLIAGQGCIGVDGRYEPIGGCDGYTCASFVAEIFRKSQCELVDLKKWPKRWANRVWGRAVVCLLKADGASAQHIDAVERNNAGLRLRPEEVAAASEIFKVGSKPSYCSIAARADQLMVQVGKECNARPLPAGHPMTPCVDQYRSELVKKTGVVKIIECFKCWMFCRFSRSCS